MTPTANTQVRIIARCCHRDQLGTVTAVVPGQDHPYRVDGIEPWPLWFGPDELEVLPQPVVAP